MNKKVLFIVVLAITLLVGINAYSVHDIKGNFGIVINRLDSIEMSIGRIQSIAARANTIQKTEANEKVKEVFTPAELAEYLNIGLDRVYDMIDNPEANIPYVNIYGEYRFSRNAIDEWLKSNKNINTAD